MGNLGGCSSSLALQLPAIYCQEQRRLQWTLPLMRFLKKGRPFISSMSRCIAMTSKNVSVPYCSQLFSPPISLQQQMKIVVPGPRCRINGKESRDYEEAFRAIFETVAKDVPSFSPSKLQTITLDFERAMHKALRSILGDKADDIIQGCEVKISRISSFVRKHL